MSSQIPELCLPNLVSQPFNQTLHRNLSNLNLHAWLLEPQQSRSRDSLRAVAAPIEVPQRGSTRSVYEAKCTIFTKWYLNNQVDFRAPPLKAIADFLLHLFQDRKLQPGTIDGYRSAIADKLGNSTINVSKYENLTCLLDSFQRHRPKGRRGIPSWNMSLVLHQLTKAPFEALKEASLKHLTFKTVFLLALGSGKCRRSMLGYIRTSDISQTGLRCLCTPHPAFVLRISWLRRVHIVWLQWSYQPWPPLWISHSRVTGPCVQLESFAITWIEPQILGRTRSWSLDISPATISSWIKQTVILCYELSDQEALTLHQVKAHVRAFAASKAFQSEVSLEQILSACHWKSHNTFTQFYLKNVAWAYTEPFHLRPVVAAPQVHHQAPK